MSHLGYSSKRYDPETKTLHLEKVNINPGPVGKIWEVDPQLQIIILLKEIKDELIAARHSKEGVVGPDARPPPSKPLLPDPVTSTVERGVVSVSHSPTSSVEKTD